MHHSVITQDLKLWKGTMISNVNLDPNWRAQRLLLHPSPSAGSSSSTSLTVKPFAHPKATLDGLVVDHCPSFWIDPATESSLTTGCPPLSLRRYSLTSVSSHWLQVSAWFDGTWWTWFAQPCRVACLGRSGVVWLSSSDASDLEGEPDEATKAGPVPSLSFERCETSARDTDGTFGPKRYVAIHVPVITSEIPLAFGVDTLLLNGASFRSVTQPRSVERGTGRRNLRS